MYYKLPNKASSVASELPEPWNYKPGPDVPYGKSKKDFETWGSQYDTDHAYISMYEGLAALVRVSESGENPVHKIHGLIVDYDSEQPDNIIEHIKNHKASEFKPNWFVETISGNCRLVWEFESPFMVADAKQLKQFLKIAKDKLLLHKWLSGFDAPAYGNPATYYEVGKKWTKVADARIPQSHLDLWFVQSLDGIRMETQSGLKYKIPIEDIAKEVHARFPNRWQGEFALKTRGVRFWDPDADNPSAAVVFPDGMYCFTGGTAFVTWREIFGPKFVEQYEADYISGVLDTTVYDGKRFWINADEDDPSMWEWYDKGDYTQHLKVRGFDSTKRKGQTSSEIDNIENAVKTKNRVKAALPFLYMKPGLMTWEGQKYINTSRVKLMQPATAPVKLTRFSQGREYFPFLYDFFKNLFMGAAGGRFTQRIVEKPLALMDDTGHAGNLRLKLAATNRIKKLVSNHTMICEEKNLAAGDVPWTGRIYVLCNTDEISLRILPDLDSTTKDKVCLYRATNSKMEFPERDSMPEILARELPLFCRFLLDMDYPEMFPNETRFGPRYYHHPSLVESAQEESSKLLVDLIADMLDMLGEPQWVGSARELYTQLEISFPESVKDFKAIGMGTRLGLLHKTGKYNIESGLHPKKRTTVWTIQSPFVKPVAGVTRVLTDEHIDSIGAKGGDDERAA